VLGGSFSTKVKAMSLYSITNSGSINASIICYMPFVEKDPELVIEYNDIALTFDNPVIAL
jgi:hypothetical protein